MKTDSGFILIMYPVMQIWIHKPNAKIRKFFTSKFYEKQEIKITAKLSKTTVILLVSNVSFLQI